MKDCLERLKYLDATGRVWGQDVLLEVQDGALLLADIETKVRTASQSLTTVEEMHYNLLHSMLVLSKDYIEIELRNRR